MEAEHLLMEQQLQETAGDLQEAERALHSRATGLQMSLQRRNSTRKLLVAETAENGPEAPAVMRPSSAPLRRESEAGSVVMPSGALVSFDSIRRDFGSMMQVHPGHSISSLLACPLICQSSCRCIESFQQSSAHGIHQPRRFE